jgi:hypothetical protein
MLKIMQCLPPQGGDYQYRIKSANEPHEPSGEGKWTRADNMMGLEFDYKSPAELFIPKRGDGGRRQAINYRRFATAAEAIRFAVEESPAVRTLGAWMRVGDQRYNGDEICRLYERNEYPLTRASVWSLASTLQTTYEPA